MCPDRTESIRNTLLCVDGKRGTRTERQGEGARKKAIEREAEGKKEREWRDGERKREREKEYDRHSERDSFV